MSFKEIIKHTPELNYIRLECWRLHAKAQLKRYDDYTFICKMYKKYCGKELNLANPTRYTEKLQWLKLFYRNELMPIVSDKYEVRKYLEDNGYGWMLNELIAVYDNVDDIDVATLPERFVLKAAHGSGWNLIVKDKTQVNWHIWKKIMKSWMKQNLYWFGREWNYESQKPRIVIEKYLEDDSGELRDYKIICMNGKPAFMQIDQNRSTNHKRVYVDTDGKPLNFGDSLEENNLAGFEFGELQKRMIEIAKELSKPFPMVRVDFYACNGSIVFGELTFFGGSGFFKFNPDSMDKELGAGIILPQPNYNLELYEKIMSESRK
ncbi:MAG: hypothetical protein IJJ41_09625 [Clostridia bacterium]|nr:hypothetical protein [Clostridia bacterium]